MDDIKRKIDLFTHLDAEQKKILEEKFLASLALVTEEELREILDFLAKHNIFITKAREVKVVANTKEEIIKKFNILEELGELTIYVKDVLKINKNVIDIFKRVQYCKQNNIPYKSADGVYESFLFNELEFQNRIKASKIVIEESVVTVEPQINEQVTIPFETPASTAKEEVQQEIIPFNNSIDIKDFMASDSIEEEPAVMNFASLENSIREMQSELDGITPQLEIIGNAKKDLLATRDSISKYNNHEPFQQDFAQELNNELDGIGFNDINFDDNLIRERKAA